jgi:hypothetical protein
VWQTPVAGGPTVGGVGTDNKRVYHYVYRCSDAFVCRVPDKDKHTHHYMCDAFGVAPQFKILPIDEGEPKARGKFHCICLDSAYILWS